MDGFCKLLTWLLAQNGLAQEHVHARATLELPGFFRPTKRWDMVVIHEGQLLAAIEFKSQRGPSFGDNFNNRAEESVGTATDLWTAYREGAFGAKAARPWLGWIMLLEDCPGSANAVGVAEPHFPVFPAFRDSSYGKRYELLLRRLRLEKLHDGAAFVMTTEREGRRGRYTEPAADLTMKKFLAGLAGHVRSYMEGR